MENEEPDQTDQFAVEDIERGLEAEKAKEEVPIELRLVEEEVPVQNKTEMDTVLETDTAPVVEAKTEATAGKVPNGKLNKVWRWTKSNFWILFWATIGLSAFILLGFLLSGVVEKTVGVDGALHQNFWWWTLGIVVVIVVIWLLLRSSKAKQYPDGTAKPLNPEIVAVAVSSPPQPARRMGTSWPVSALAIFGGVILFGLLLGVLMDDGPNLSKPVASAMVTETTENGWNLPTEIVLSIIADCESGDKCQPGTGRQFNKDGSVVTNKNKDGTIDIGKWQINSRHEVEAKANNIDLTTEEGNQAFTMRLYKREGLNPWKASRSGWEPLLLSYGSGVSVANTYVARAGEPVVISIPPDYRRKMVGELPTVGLYSEKYLDADRNLIETIGVVPPATEAIMHIAITKCRSQADCASTR
ncbi:MAG: hypothetical protein AAB719_01180 [Patescibacteria group bacterium]